jgi:hypothetical protein
MIRALGTPHKRRERLDDRYLTEQIDLKDFTSFVQGSVLDRRCHSNPDIIK